MSCPTFWHAPFTRQPSIAALKTNRAYDSRPFQPAVRPNTWARLRRGAGKSVSVEHQMMRLASKRDVDALYVLFLGRLPEDEQVYRNHFHRPILETTEGIIKSDEFRGLLNHFLQGGVLPHCRLPADLLREAIEVAIESGLAAAELLEFHIGDYQAKNLEARDAAECIEAAYRIILRREPDPEGRDHYLDLLLREAWPKRRLIEDLMASDEFGAVQPPLRVVWRDEAGTGGCSPNNGGPERPDWIGVLRVLWCSGPVNQIINAHHREAERRLSGLLKSSAPVLSERTDQCDGGELEMSLDLPALLADKAEIPAPRALRIRGWAAARHGVSSVDVAIDGDSLGSAHYGIVRPDVAAAFPDWRDAAQSGFSTIIPRSRLPQGRHIARVGMRDSFGRIKTLEFSIDVREGAEDLFSLRRKIGQTEINLNNQILSSLDWHPTFCLLILVGHDESEIERLHLTLSSLRDQAYPGWRAYIVSGRRGGNIDALRDRLVDGSDDATRLCRAVRSYAHDAKRLRGDPLAGLADISERVEVLQRDAAQSLAELAGRLPGSVWAGVLAAGDELSCDALLEFAVATGMRRDVDFFYSDELRWNPISKAVEPFFKPDWSPDLLLSTNYIGRIWFVTAQLIERTGATLEELLRRGEYDLVLRATETANGVRRVPELLCKRGDGRLDSEEAERQALERAMARRGIAGQIRCGCSTGTYRLKRTLAKGGLVSIVIPAFASPHAAEALTESLREQMTGRKFEIICIDDLAPSDTCRKGRLWAVADKIIEVDEPFNWARFANMAAAEASGEVLVFLSGSAEIVTPEWLDTLLEHVCRPEVGVAGPQLLGPDRRVEHGGIFLAPETGRPTPAFYGIEGDDPGFFGLALTQRNVIAVSGECLATRREVFARLGPFDETLDALGSAVDYCIKAWAHGLVNVFTPYAKLISHECGVSRQKEADASESKSHWRAILADGDPYHHPRLSTGIGGLIPEPEPLRVICPGSLLPARDKIRKVLIVKLDHIGDAVTAFPAIRRLKEHFPHASLRVLAASWTRSLWASTGLIDEVIEFDLFHARSSSGLREVSDADLSLLGKRLAAHRFDLAIDLRKHPETRQILRVTGARYLAGFDYEQHFPWLDVALDWAPDPPYARDRMISPTPRRQSAGHDLINLVDAVATSCGSAGAAIAVPSAAPLRLPEAEQRRLFGRRVVCIHPAAGDDMKQWPPEHFAELIDLMVERDTVNIALIGGGGDRPVADRILKLVRHGRAVFDLVGRFDLSDLPIFMSRCALFVGNDSGPKHLAAAVGLPTVGIHSGHIDAREWGPVGPYAVALRRDVDCGPCYLGRPEECPRHLACLNRLRPGEVYNVCRKLLLVRQAFSPETDPALAKRMSLISRR